MKENTKAKENKNKNKNTTTRGSFFAFSKCMLAILLVFSLLLPLCSCSSEQSFSTVYSFGEISLTSYNLSKSEFSQLKGSILAIAENIQNTVSLSREDSELSTLNKTVGGEVSNVLKEQLEIAISLWEKTNGNFNILLAKVVEEWGFLPGSENYGEEKVPAQEILEAHRKSTDMSQLTLSGNTLKKMQESQIDLGGISKGYMASLMLEEMKNANCDGILNVGGIIIASGDKGGKGYSVAITNPQGGSYFDVIKMQDATLVTSGNYERYFLCDGVRYCHIINPETLRPTTSDVASVSILSQDPTTADGFATALMIAGQEEREEIISKNEISCLLIYSDGTSETFGNFPNGE